MVLLGRVRTHKQQESKNKRQKPRIEDGQRRMSKRRSGYRGFCRLTVWLQLLGCRSGLALFFFLRLAVVLSWLDCVRSRGNETELLLSESTCQLVGQVEGRIGMVSRAPLLVEVDFGRGVEGRCDEKRQAGRGRNSFVFTLGVSHGNWTGLASLRRGRGPQFLGGVTGR